MLAQLQWSKMISTVRRWSHRSFPEFIRAFGLGMVTCLVFLAAGIVGQEAKSVDPGSDEVPKIADVPATIDPATLVPDVLAVKKTAELKDAPLRDVIRWLESEGGVEVLLDGLGLTDIGVLETDPVGETLDETPLYQMLNRLSVYGLGWYYDEGIVHITSRERAEGRLTMLPYNVGDLFDAGFEGDALLESIVHTIEPDSWEEMGGEGVINLIGDVIFIRQNDRIHREVKGLLQALRTHGRQTFISEPSVHTLIRAAVENKATLDFDGVPLQDAVAELIDQTKLDFRLDLQSLAKVGVRERTPVTIALKETPLDVVLQAMLNDLELTWVLRDGVVWFVSLEDAESIRKTAVYDVRDLCRDAEESYALQQAIASQDCENWEDCGGVGTMSAPKPGILVLYNTESALMQVLELLEAYRAALRGSKPRKMKGSDPDEVITVYYRLQTPVAEGLEKILPVLVEPDSWKKASPEKGVGEILLTASTSDPGTQVTKASEDSKAAVTTVQTPFVNYSVLIVTQTRGRHEEIAKVISRVQQGDADPRFGPDSMGGAMGGLGSGGFGGGFLQLGEQMPLLLKERGR
jgi:hypothetical protein